MKWKMAQAFAGLAETILYLKVFSNFSVLLTYTQFTLYTGQRFIQSAHVLTANVIYSGFWPLLINIKKALYKNLVWMSFQC